MSDAPLRATSVAAPLDALPPGPLRLLHSSARAINFVASDGALLSLVAGSVGDGPFHIVLPIATLPQVDPTTAALWDGRQVRIGQVLVVETDSAPRWNPQLDPLPVSADYTKDIPEMWGWLLAVAPPESLAHAWHVPGTIWQARCQPRLMALRGAIATADDRALAEAAQRLVGVGPGLTPAGDDLLVGLLAARALAALPPLPLALPPRATTTLSAAFLRAALAGAFAAPWHRLRAALISGDALARAQALRAQAAIGATSGADALAGFLLHTAVPPLE